MWPLHHSRVTKAHLHGHAPVRARSSPPFTPPLPNLAAPSSRGVPPGQGLSLNRRHLPVVSIAQLSVISHYFLNLFSALRAHQAHEAQQVEGKASQPRGPEHHTATLFIYKCLFARFTFHISLLTRQLKDIWKHFRTFLNNVNKHKSAVFTVDFGQFFTVNRTGFFPSVHSAMKHPVVWSLYQWKCYKPERISRTAFAEAKTFGGRTKTKEFSKKEELIHQNKSEDVIKRFLTQASFHQPSVIFVYSPHGFFILNQQVNATDEQCCTSVTTCREKMALKLF